MTEVCVRLVGPVTVWRDGRGHAGRDLGSRKARTLVALLSMEPGRLVSMDRIVEMLWGERPPRRPPANVATLVSRLRSTFGPDFVVGGRSGYRLGDDVTTDLDESMEMLTAARARLAAGYPARALASAAGALELVGAALRPDRYRATGVDSVVLADQPDTTWTETARVAHREVIQRGRHTAAAAAIHAGDHPTALAAARAGVIADPLDEIAYRLLMRAYCALDEPGRALRAYEHLRGTLARELGCDPARATRDLHLAILRDEQCLRPTA
jgi:DNA-binding SARP family transcriptional activator